ncbi:MAG: RnfABCDGE type electron transport complex subunit D [Bacteroidales bacterium]|nr:RnfABCDGE type electron transport complex subunit D [Bacteroidales bacterium]
MSLLKISGSPHVHGDQSVEKIMKGVCWALMPTILVAVYCFGFGAVRVLLIATVSAVFFEWFIQKFFLKKPSTIRDFSAILTGILLALNVPSSLPWYMIIIGSFVAIAIAKMVFGGLGNNIFNPALVGRVFLLVSFPVQMTLWPKPFDSARMWFFNGFKGLDQTIVDSITGPTPLGILQNNGASAIHRGEYADYILGFMGGSIGEISALAILVGGIFLLWRKIITWHIPVSFILTSFIFSGILWLVNPVRFADPVFHILTGGLMLGAVFMATDMVTSPMTRKGMLLFGFGCGMMTILIRSFGAYPEGVSFAILIMNAFVPLINKGFKPKRFGKEVQHG